MNHVSYATKPVVIVGCQRSGTTLLRTILGRHPQLLQHPYEPHFILELYQRFGYTVRDVGMAVAYLLKHPYLPDNITAEALKAAYATDGQLTLQAFFQKYLHVWAGGRLLTQRPILKHPALTYHLDLVTTLFPQATIVHVVRDPRATVASQTIRWAHYTTYETAMLWKNALKSVEHFVWQQNDFPVIEISYEKMLLQPEQEIASLCQQLGIEFLPDMLSFEEETLEFTPDALPKRVMFHTVDVSRLNQWQERLSPMEICLIEYLCQKEMAAWGYEVTDPPVPAQQLNRQVWAERMYYYYKINGRRLKHIGRKIGWRFGIGLLKIPPP